MANNYTQNQLHNNNTIRTWTERTKKKSSYIYIKSGKINLSKVKIDIEVEIKRQL